MYRNKRWLTVRNSIAMSSSTEKKIYTPEPIRTSREQIESFVDELSRTLSFSYKDDLWSLVSRLNGVIEIGSTGEEDRQSGSIIVNNSGKFKIFLSPFTSVNRDRFTIAHELGHFFLHYPVIRNEMRSLDVFRATRFVDETNPSQRLAEKEANWFAFGLLMPRIDFEKYYEESEGDLGLLAREFRVSLQAVSIREQTLQLRDRKMSNSRVKE